MPDSTLLFLLAIGVVAGAATVQGTIGFGYNILIVPVLSLFMATTVIVPALVMHSVVIDAVIIATAWRALELQRVRLLILTGLIGTPVGVAALSTLDPQPLQIILGVIVVIVGLAMLAGVRRSIKDERLASVAAGSAGGVMNGLLGMGAPPLVLLFANQESPPAQTRANTVAFLAITSVLAIAAFAYSGSITRDVLEVAVATSPGSVLGVVTGIFLNSRVPLQLFRRLTLFMVILAGFSALVAGVLG